jgi:hypothetical protein
MAQRRFGPTRAAGVALVEQEGDKPIQSAALGFAGYAGIFEKGKTNKLIVVTSKKQFVKKMGSYIPDSLAPDTCFNYFNLANGAGGLLLVRVTDGNELQSSLTLYGRYANVLTPMGVIKANNGGRWGGKEARYTADVTADTDITNVTLDTGVTMKVDEWKGGFVELEDVPNKRYQIIGNTDEGLISVATDQTMKDDYDGASGTSLRYYLTIDADREKAVSVLISDGEENATTEFSLAVYVDGEFIKKYPNLNTNPTSGRYWVNVINNDDGNDEIEAVDLWTGAHAAPVRPANHYGIVDTVTETLMHAVIYDFAVSSPGGGNPTFALGATDDEMVAQKITITMSGATSGAAVSDKFGALGTVTLGTAFVPNNKWAPEFTVTAGASPLVATDVLTVHYKPFKSGELVGGYLYPDKANARNTKFRIIANDHDSVTVADGSDLTADGAADDEYMIEAKRDLEGGRDGNSEVVDATYNQKAWDTGLSPFNRVAGMNLGVIKMSTPGIASVSVQQNGRAYAEAKNHQYRYEIPSNVTTEQGAIDFVNDTLGRSDFAVVAFPSYGSVPDPESDDGKLKLVSLTGMIHGREARIAADYDGYHKAEAGLDATLPGLLKVTTLDSILDEEQLNPVGIATIKKVKGNFVIWGDRTLYTDANWKWKHQRELMSYYEHVLQENFDWIVFAINDPVTEKVALTALKNYFLPEFTKRALRGKTFDEAATFKIDAENNTAASRTSGDMYADVALQLADTVERFVIRIGKQGIFESP